jgi:hypothetical protein
MATEPIESQKPENEANPQEEPQIFSVVRGVNGSLYNRRNFIEKTVLTSAATTIIATGCSFMAKPVDVKATVDAAVAATDAANQPVEPQVAAVEATQAPVEEPAIAPTDTPIPTASPVPPSETPAPSATPEGIKTTIKGDSVNLRVGPSTGFPPITRLPSGTEVTLTSRLPDNSWVGVALRDPKKQGHFVLGWIKTSLVETRNIDVKSLPAITEIPPTPTPLPGKYGHTAVGLKGIDYEYTDEYGNVYPMTLPCGSTIPEGAVCTCNCVTVAVTHDCGCDDLHYWYPN